MQLPTFASFKLARARHAYIKTNDYWGLINGVHLVLQLYSLVSLFMIHQENAIAKA